METIEKQLLDISNSLLENEVALQLAKDIINDPCATINSKTRAKLEVLRLTGVIDEQRKTIANLKTELVKTAVEIIKPYLKTKGIDLEINSPEDTLVFWVEKKEDTICLSYYHCYIKPVVDTIKRKEFESISGTIVYDVNGNVLIDRIVGEKGMSYAKDTGKAEYKYVEPGHSLISDDLILIKRDNTEDYNLISYHLYRRENGKYKLVHVFSKADNAIYNDSFVCTPSMLENGVVAYSGKLYNINEKRYLNDLQFNKVCAYDSYKYIGPYSYDNNGPHKGLLEKLSETLKAQLKENNLLYGEVMLHTPYYEKHKTGNPSAWIKTPVFVLLDMNGNIVSDLFFELKNEIRRVKVDNESFDTVLKNVVEKEVLEAKEREERIKRNIYYRKKAMDERRVEEMVSFVSDVCNKKSDKSMVFSSKASRNKKQKSE
ncbi:MAG: hypothetical protein IKZ96_00685 [Bacilli bacterium]|nr:hypothetical protein [Bacilli bacterium]